MKNGSRDSRPRSNGTSRSTRSCFKTSILLCVAHNSLIDSGIPMPLQKQHENALLE
jgi:hypothetical protein